MKFDSYVTLLVNQSQSINLKKGTWYHLLLHEALEWHLELHSCPDFLQAHRFVEHCLRVAAHVQDAYPWPPNLDCVLAACRRERYVSGILSLKEAPDSCKSVAGNQDFKIPCCVPTR